MAIDLNDGVMVGNLRPGTKVFYSTDIELSDRSIVIASYPIAP